MPQPGRGRDHGRDAARETGRDPDEATNSFGIVLV
jgi:hypothetical protein